MIKLDTTAGAFHLRGSRGHPKCAGDIHLITFSALFARAQESLARALTLPPGFPRSLSIKPTHFMSKLPEHRTDTHHGTAKICWLLGGGCGVRGGECLESKDLFVRFHILSLFLMEVPYLFFVSSSGLLSPSETGWHQDQLQETSTPKSPSSGERERGTRPSDQRNIPELLYHRDSVC